ncbi:DNA topoisomerase, partial [Glomus cerebriforme]
KNFLQDHANSAEVISQQIITTAQNRAKVDDYKKTLGKGRGVSRPEKLSPSIIDDELFIVEGESAGGSAKSARDPNNQAVLPVQGKIINVEKSKQIKILENKEIKNLINALGLSVSEATENYYNRFRSKLDTEVVPSDLEIPKEFVYQDENEQEQIILAHTFLTPAQLKKIVEKTQQNLLKKLRYNKIVIMTDADPDGRHIECLALAFFARYFRYLIEEHRLYLAVPPLYRYQTKKEVKYFYSDYELEKYRQQNPVPQSARLQRFKGLGEMNPQQLRETTMAARQRCLHELLFSNPPTIYEIIRELMGEKSDQRKKRLDSGEHKNAQLKSVENKVEIDQALLVKFLDYAYAVVEDRALPQLQDGLKPVQRRILYTLYELGLLPNRAHRKAAKVVGDVIGKYHPHGDQSVYQAMVKMAQDFNYRYPLIDEPKILPANLNLLCNGSSGIAVGMSTNIPPHNLGEVVDITTELLNNPQLNCQSTNLKLNYFGPDFPTGGQILEQEKLTEIYEKGGEGLKKGTIYVRAQAEILSSNPKGRKDLIQITQLPFKVNKAKLVTRINQIIKEGKIDGLKGLKSVADYSNYEKLVNIHCHFDPNYDGEVILNQLYKSTRLQTSFSFKMRALIDDQPHVFSLKEILQGFINQRLENIQKKAQFIYHKNQKDLISKSMSFFIIENYQAIAQTIQKSSTEEEIKQNLIDRFQGKLGEQKSLSIDLFLTDLLRETEKVLKILQKKIDSLKFSENLAEKKEYEGEYKKYTELVNLMRQIAKPDGQKGENEKENQMSELKKKAIKLDFQEQVMKKLSGEFTLLETLNSYDSEQEVINRLLDTPAKFRQFTPEQKAKLTNDIRGLHENNLQQQLLIIHQEHRKQHLIQELAELKKDYAHDERKTLLTSTLRFITERQLIPHEERIIFLSRSENRKENKVSNFLTVHLVASLEGTNIPSTGKELKTLNKPVNLDEEYLVRKRKGKYESVLQTREFITHTLPAPEESAHQFKSLLVITKKGKIKKLKLTDLQKISKSGKKVIKLGEKGRCSPHQTRFIEHKTADCCDKSQGIKAYTKCSQFQELQRQIRECNACKQSHLLSEPKLKKQIRKCQQIVNCLIIKPNELKEDLILLLIKKDGGCEKKSFLTAKNFLGVDSKQKRKLEGKINDSPVEETQNEKATSDQYEYLTKRVAHYENSLTEVIKQQSKLKNFSKTEEIEKCKDCQKYCSGKNKHQEQVNKLNKKHQDKICECSPTGEQSKKNQQIKDKITQLKKQIKELENQPDSRKKIEKLNRDLTKQKEQGKQLRNELSVKRLKCPK